MAASATSPVPKDTDTKVDAPTEGSNVTVTEGTGGSSGAGRAAANLTPLGKHLKKKWRNWITARVVNVVLTGDVEYLYAHPEHGGRLVSITEAEYEALDDKEKSAVSRTGEFYGHAVEEDDDGKPVKTHFFHSTRCHEPILCAGNVGKATFFFGGWPRQVAKTPAPVFGNYIMAYSVPSREREDMGYCTQWHRMSDQFYHLWDVIVNDAIVVADDLDCRNDVDEVCVAWTLRKRRWAVSSLEMGARCPEYRFTYHTIASLARTDYTAPAGKTDTALKAWIEAAEW